MTLQALALFLLLMAALAIWIGVKRTHSSSMKAAFIGAGAVLLLAAMVPVAILLLMLGYSS